MINYITFKELTIKRYCFTWEQKYQTAQNMFFILEFVYSCLVYQKLKSFQKSHKFVDRLAISLSS